MPWMIQHKCHLSDSQVGEYAVVKKDLPEKITHIKCSNCGEYFNIVGHEMFDEMQPAEVSGYNLPPGFVVARSRTS